MSSNHKKAVRKAFRDSVFERDGHKCLFCEIAVDLDAHHIINRNLMPNGGYVLSNGATLCPKHHIDAESGALTVETIRETINFGSSDPKWLHNKNHNQPSSVEIE